MMKVKAKENIIENGFHKKGEIFEIDENRYGAIKHLVELIEKETKHYANKMIDGSPRTKKHKK